MPVSQAVFTGILCAAAALWPAWDRGLAALDELNLTLLALAGALVAGGSARRGAIASLAMIAGAIAMVNLVTDAPRVLLPPWWTMVRLAALSFGASAAAAWSAGRAIRVVVYAALAAVYLLSRGDLALDRVTLLALVIAAVQSWLARARNA